MDLSLECSIFSVRAEYSVEVSELFPELHLLFPPKCVLINFHLPPFSVEAPTVKKTITLLKKIKV